MTGAIEGFEQGLLAERKNLEQEALELFENGDEQEARDLITENVKNRLLESLSLGMDLSDEIEEETREKFGLREPEGRDNPGETTPASSQPMAQGGSNDMVYVYDEDLHEFPREHGSFTEETKRDRDNCGVKPPGNQRRSKTRND